MRKTAGIVLAISLFPLVLIMLTNTIVHYTAAKQTYDQVQDIDKNKVGLLLGTARYHKLGGENLFFKYRIEAAVKLFNNRKIDFILVSGDNAHLSYNEPRELKRALIQRGIPGDKIIMDYAGFRTLDSVVRAKKVFGQDEITIISQEFHNIRALYLAQKFGIEAVAFNAETPKLNTRIRIREYLAKTKAYLDGLLKVKPKFLGEPIEIAE